MSCCSHCPECSHETPTRRFRPIAAALKLLVLYVVLIAGAGTLINTGHPVAVEFGKLIHVVTFVDPLIAWTDSHDLPVLARGARTLADGIPLS